MKNKVVASIVITIALVAVLFVEPASAVSGYVQQIVVRRTLYGSTSSVTVYNHPNNWVNPVVDFDVEYGVRITVYAGGGSADWYYHVENLDSEYREIWDGPDTSHNFYPWPPIEGDYFAAVDGTWAGGTGSTFELRGVYPDLITSNPSPETSGPYCVGQMVDWYTTVTNQGGGEADSTYVGYYIGTGSSDFSSRYQDDSTGTLSYSGGSSAEHEQYTFTAGDVGTRYINVWADYPADLEESNENNNKNSSNSFQVIDTPSAASLSSPGNGSNTCDTTPTFSWGSVSGATLYRIQVDDDPAFGSPAINTTTGSTSYTPDTALSTDTWYWRVLTYNSCGEGSYSGARSFTILSPLSSAPSLSSPSNGSSTCDTTSTFSWGSVSGAASYRIQVDDALGFGSPAIDTTTSNTSHTPGMALSMDTYHWRVLASNSCGDSIWSSSWNVAVNAIPGTPTLTSSSDGANICDSTPQFTWSSVSGASEYRIQVDDSSGFGSPLIDVTQAGTSYTPGAAITPGTYYWRVRAESGCGDSSWSSSTRDLTVLAPVVSDFSATPTSGAVPLSVQFTSLASSQIDSWYWSFGDGATSTQTNPLHQYTDEDSFDVSLTVTGTCGSDTETETGYVFTGDYTVYVPMVMRNHVHRFEGPREQEDNDTYQQANGALHSGRYYGGDHDDKWDYYWIYLPGSGNITAELGLGSGGGVQLQLLYESGGNVHPIEYRYELPYRIEYTGAAGLYYVAIYTASGHSISVPYTLRVTYP